MGVGGGRCVCVCVGGVCVCVCVGCVCVCGGGGVWGWVCVWGGGAGVPPGHANTSQSGFVVTISQKFSVVSWHL